MWLVMGSVLWNLEPITNGRQINGTYWMHYKADMFVIKSDLKETSRLRRYLGDAAIDGFFNFLYKFLTLYDPMIGIFLLCIEDSCFQDKIVSRGHILCWQY